MNYPQPYTLNIKSAPDYVCIPEYKDPFFIAETLLGPPSYQHKMAPSDRFLFFLQVISWAVAVLISFF